MSRISWTLVIEPKKLFTGILIGLTLAAQLNAERAPGLHVRVEILRDKWGVPHIYAANTDDLFFAQGWIAAKDRLFQIDLWRRAGSGKLAEVLGPSAVRRDRIARLLRYRGDWNKEWDSYAPDARGIVTAFVNGINAYIRSLNGRRPLEFQIAGYDPGLWSPEDVVSRTSGLEVATNLTREIDRSMEIAKFGVNVTEQFAPPDPFVHLVIPPGLDIHAITSEIVGDYEAAAGPARFGEGGSNNWVIDGSMSVTGKPLLANDPHREILVPSLRKIVHLVAPGWNAIGAGEPALPGIELGHNQSIGFGLTIVGTDQQDLYVEKLNPANASQYMYKGEWKTMQIEKQQIAVKGAAPVSVELRFTGHGPIIYEDRARHLAYALRWIGSEPGGAAYLGALSAARAKDWKEFLTAMARFKSPAENMVYADTAGNVGWIAAGAAPVRANWTGLLPVPGDSGQYEWNGFVPIAELPQSYNPARHFLATANNKPADNKIVPPNDPKPIAYDWADSFRVQRIGQMLSEPRKFDVADFERMQYDVECLPARRFQVIVRKSRPARHGDIVDEFLKWDAQLTADSRPGLVYELWMSALISSVYPHGWTGGVRLEVVLKMLEARPNATAIADALDRTMSILEQNLPHRDDWKWSALHTLVLRHPLNTRNLNLPGVPRPGDSETVNAAGGERGLEGASYRQILDVADWDRSVVTNTPGESGDPQSKHYRDLLEDWLAGRYHPLPFSRKAVEAAMEERIVLEP
jgi:penicillin G amidase